MHVRKETIEQLRDALALCRSALESGEGYSAQVRQATERALDAIRQAIEAPAAGEMTLWHQSGVSPKGAPFVQLLLGDQIIGQLDPVQAREHARAVMEAAEAAEQDAFLVDFARAQIGLGGAEAGELLMAFRQYRHERTGKSQGPRNPKDWVMPPADQRPDYGDITKKQGGKP